MSSNRQQHLESEDELQIQRATEASIHSSVRSQLSQGNSTARLQNWEAQSSLTHLDPNPENPDPSPYSYTRPEYSGYRENSNTESDTDDGEGPTMQLDRFGAPVLPSREEILQAKMRAIVEGGTSTHIDADVKMVPARVTIDDCIAEMRQSRAVSLERLDIPDGDTLVFIDAPAQQPHQDQFTYTEIQARYLRPFRVRSSTLKSLCSPFFDSLFSSTAQFRVLRRRKLVNNLPRGIIYALDLTPPSEGDVAANLTQDLSCTMGVRQWGLSRDRWKISEGLVGGQDELSRVRMPVTPAKPTSKIQWFHGQGTVTETVVVNDTANLPGAATTTPVQRSTVSTSDSSPALQDQHTGTVRDGRMLQLPADYAPIRHRFAIERVLHGIEGRDPEIDSAVKMWTTFAVARHFSIRDSLLTDYIVRWLRASPNTYFMEVQLEVVLKIAEGLHCQALGRDVFAILVGEAALAVVYEGGSTDPHYSVHGRKREFVDEVHFEPWMTRIQYARDSLVERVKARFEELTAVGSTWVEELPECQKLLVPTHRSQPHRIMYAELMKELKAYVRGVVYYLLCSNYYTMPGPVEDSGKGAELFPQTQFCSTWNLLTHHERVFTRAFWINLRGCHLVMSNPDYGIKPGYKYHVSGRTSYLLRDLVKTGVFRNIYPGELRRRVDAYNSLHENGMKETTKTVSHLQGYNGAHFGQGHAAELRARNYPPTFNIAYRPRTDETGSSISLPSAEDDWRRDYVAVPEHSSNQSSYNAPMSGSRSNPNALCGEPSNASKKYHGQMFSMLSQQEDIYNIPKHDEAYYVDDDDYECREDDVDDFESSYQQSDSNMSEQSSPRLQARHVRRARKNKLDLEDLHRQNRSSSRERQQHHETICTGSPSSSPYRNFDPYAQDSVSASHGSLGQNLLSDGLRPRQTFVAGSSPVSKTSTAGGFGASNAETSATRSDNRETSSSPPPAFSSHSFIYKADTLDPTPSAPQSNSFDLAQFFTEVERHLHSVATEMLASPDAGQRDALDLALTNTLVCLTESELKYLPLWAGGNDDGSSGVFNDNVPLAETGFSTAGPDVHTGTASSAAASEFDMLRDGDDSTVHTSTAVNDGHSDVLDRRRVYDDDSEWGTEHLASEAQTTSGYEPFEDSEALAGCKVTALVGPVVARAPEEEAAAEEAGAEEAGAEEEREEDYGEFFLYSDDEDEDDDDDDDDDDASDDGVGLVDDARA
ncbi:hypothetical protein MMC26_002623 [Xylographa opegraphella]|nr:hypothetical protein [Xylographa opegraphella]